MPGSVQDRLQILLSKTGANPYCGRVGPWDPVKCAFTWDGLKQRRLLGSMSVTPLEGPYQWVQLPEYGLAWLTSVPLRQLATVMSELRTARNGHYYFHSMTPVAPGDHVVDVGACEGAFGLECIYRYGAERVYNFEPDARMARALAFTAERNHLGDRYRIIEAAVGDEAGVIGFVEPVGDVLLAHVITDLNPAQAGRVTEVPQIALDDWMEEERIENVSYLKIDVEGYDAKVLLGARELIRRWRPKIAVATYHIPHHAEEIYRLLTDWDLDYRIEVKGLVSYDRVARPVMLHARC